MSHHNKIDAYLPLSTVAKQLGLKDIDEVKALINKGKLDLKPMLPRGKGILASQVAELQREFSQKRSHDDC